MFALKPSCFSTDPASRSFSLCFSAIGPSSGQGLTQHQVLPGHFPGQVIGKVNGVDIDVLVAVLAHRLDHLPPDLISRFLGDKHKMKEWTSALSTPVASLKTPLTFLQTAMRMMIDMMMMATNARTAASTAT